MGWVMKKILICVLCMFCLLACDKKDETNYKQEFVDYSSELTKYTLDAQMKVVKNNSNVMPKPTKACSIYVPPCKAPNSNTCDLLVLWVLFSVFSVIAANPIAKL